MFCDCCKGIAKAARCCSMLLAALYMLALAPQIYAGGIQTLDVVEVTDTTEDLVGTADSATEGTALREEVQVRPYHRVGEELEVTPGLIVTQHSGEGKANQYVLGGVSILCSDNISI